MKKINIIIVICILSLNLYGQDINKFKIYKIDPNINNGLDISYTIPEIFNEKQSSTPSIYKSYSSPLLENSYIIVQEIGITKNEIELNENSKEVMFKSIDNSLSKSLGDNYKQITKKKTKLYFFDAIELRNNITLIDNQDKIYKDQIMYTVFIGKNVVRFIYKCIYTNPELLKSNADYFKDYVEKQKNNIIIRNLFSNK